MYEKQRTCYGYYKERTVVKILQKLEKIKLGF